MYNKEEIEILRKLIKREKIIKLKLANYIDASDLHIAITKYNNGGSLNKVKREFHKLKEKYPNKDFMPVMKNNDLFVEIKNGKNR